MMTYGPYDPKYYVARKHDSNSPSQADDVMALLGGERKRFLTEAINKIKTLRLDRDRIYGLLLRDLEAAELAHTAALFGLQNWGEGILAVVERRQSHLEQLCADVSQQRRAELVGHWQDVAQLNRELQELLREYVELKIRLQLVS